MDFELVRVDDIEHKAAVAIERLRTFEPPEGYYVAFSGGKDSQCVLQLAKESGVRYDAHMNLTTVDPPEVIYFIREHYPDVERHYPPESMWSLIARKSFPPTRVARYCCEALKERGMGTSRVVVTGIRWAESARRKKRMLTETCMTDPSKTYLHPIIDWSTGDVWAYLESRNLPHCSLYDEGHRRIGCVMCPMGDTRQMRRDAKRWPKIASAYRRACQKAYQHREDRGVDQKAWQGGDDMYEWWISGAGDTRADDGQILLFE